MNKGLSEQSYQSFRHFLHAESGVVLGAAKQYLVVSRLVPLMIEHGIDDINDLVDKVIAGSDVRLSYAAVEALTTNETLWFRDQYPFTILSNTLLPALAKTQSTLRIWSAACSSGQEPYSIAMSFLEFKAKHPTSFPGGLQILASDISLRMLALAERAVYDQLSLSRGLGSAMKDKYFSVFEGNAMQVQERVREHVKFKQFNLTGDFSGLGKFDMVFCRNVLIYFDEQQKNRILQEISACLQPQGVLMLGASEFVSNVNSQFNMLREPTGLYYSKVR